VDATAPEPGQRHDPDRPICQWANCPNVGECALEGEASFLVGGEYCVRQCGLCPVATGRPPPFDGDEPRRVAATIQQLRLRYVTIAGVARDDLPDAGAWLFTQIVREVRRACPGTGVELLVPDFGGEPTLISQVIEVAPQVWAHSLTTVSRLFKKCRPGFNYRRSLSVLAQASKAGLVTKSNLTLGLGEKPQEVVTVLADLSAVGCELLTLSQYQPPSPRHYPLARRVTDQEFAELASQAKAMGFLGVQAGPEVRPSYRARQLWAQAMAASGRPVPSSLTALASQR